jgi:hypothetical protein
MVRFEMFVNTRIKAHAKDKAAIKIPVLFHILCEALKLIHAAFCSDTSAFAEVVRSLPGAT